MIIAVENNIEGGSWLKRIIGNLEKIVTLMIIFCFTFLCTQVKSTNLLNNSRGPLDEMDVNYSGNPVTIDGIMSSNEWSDAQIIDIIIDSETWSIYRKHDEANIYFALSYPVPHRCNITFDIDLNEGNAPQTDDIQIRVEKQKLEFKGNGTGWEYRTPSGWDANVDIVDFREIRISYSKLGITKGIEKDIGICFKLETYINSSYWPSESTTNNPSTWGMIISSDDWDDLGSSNYSPILSDGNVDPLSGLPDTQYNFSVRYTDVDNDPSTINKVIIDGIDHDMQALGTTYHEGVNYRLITNLEPGEHSYHFLFSDGTNSTRLPEEGNFSGPFVILPNSPPKLLNAGIPNGTFSFKEDSEEGIGLIDLEEYFSDDHDDGNLEFEIVYQEDTKKIRAEINGSYIDFFQIEENWHGPIRFKVKAKDRGVMGQSGRENILETFSNEFTIVVTPINDPPRISKIGNVNIQSSNSVTFEGIDAILEDSWFNITIEVEDTDLIAGSTETLDFSINSTDVNLDKISETEVTFSFLPQNYDVGKRCFLFTVGDLEGEKDTLEINIEIMNTNDDPYIDSYVFNDETFQIIDNKIEFIGEEGPLEDEWFNITIISIDDDIKIGYSDSLIYDIIHDAGNLKIDSSLGLLSFLPKQEDVGTLNVKVTVKDSYGSNIDSTVDLTFEIQNTNDPPLIEMVKSSTGVFQFINGENSSINVIASDTDMGYVFGEKMRFEWYSDIDGFLQSGDTLDISNLSPGEHEIRVEVKDNENAMDSFVFIVNIATPSTSDESWLSSNYGILFFILLCIFLSLVLSLLVLLIVTRINEKNLFDNLKRRQIYDFIKQNPGHHFFGIQQDLRLPFGVVSHHTNILEKFQYIKSLQDGKYRRFYLYDEKIDYKLKLTSIQEMILFIINKEPGISQTGISKKIGKNKMVVNYNVRILKDVGMIFMEKEGRVTRCFITNAGFNITQA